MKKIILEKLKDIEKKENVKIIYAVESGSRAWGFESIDSDYDVRFIYVRNSLDYLSLFDKKDTINYQCDEVFDINGWDVSKALKLLYKSNPTLYEWKHSPIVYLETKQWQLLQEAFHTYFQTPKALHHYYHIAMQSYNTNFLTIKKCLYTLRAIFSCLWIIEKQTPPPIEFDVLMQAQLPQELKSYVIDLLNLKKSQREKTICLIQPILNEYIQQQFQYIQSHLSKGQVVDNPELLDQTFRGILSSLEENIE